jgi:DNA-binding MarR family transcriptional regulator
VTFRKTGDRRLRGRQQTILDAIRLSLEARGHAPTMKELAYDLRIHRSSLARNYYKLIKLGYLRKLPTGTLPVEIIS